MQSEDPLGHTGRSGSPTWSAFGRGDTASPLSKDPVGPTELPCSPAQEQRLQLEAAYPGASFVLRFTLNSMQSWDYLLGQDSTGYHKARSSPRGSAQVTTKQVSEV